MHSYNLNKMSQYFQKIITGPKKLYSYKLFSKFEIANQILVLHLWSTRGHSKNFKLSNIMQDYSDIITYLISKLYTKHKMASSIKCKKIMFNSVVACIWDTTCMHWKWMRLTKNCFLWSASNIYKWNSNWYFPIEYSTKLISTINWKISKII